MNKTFVSPSFFKQKSTQLQKEKSLTWHQALDEAARAFGFSNYKNYRNLSKVNRNHPKFYREVILKNISSENDKFKKNDQDSAESVAGWMGTQDTWEYHGR
jgi:hypothetical protein